jgi:hypothetical protein
MKPTLDSAVSEFGRAVKAKSSSARVTGTPEDQLRAPFEALLTALAQLVALRHKDVVAVGESAVAHLRTRPDYAVTVRGALVGHVELKAPGKGADPRRFHDAHDKAQWSRLRSLPNLLYSDGNEFSLWRDGELFGDIVKLDGDVQRAGGRLRAPPSLGSLIERFLSWEPTPPRSAKELAHVAARLCRLVRDEVTEQLAAGSPALTTLARDWRKLLFPEANDETFADGYAQAVTFGLLMARAKGIRLGEDLGRVASELAQTSSLIGTALRLLTESEENQATLKTSLGTLVRVLDAIDWPAISKGRADAWLYFYEDFLEVYDKALRKLTGSYYTPPEVVGAMVRLVDDVLRSPRYGRHAGLASPNVTLADPATGTGTFLLGVLRKIAERVKEDEGEGAVGDAIDAAVSRLIAFEMQLGPFAVAQLRVLAEIVDLAGAPPSQPVRMFVTNTLGDPQDEEGWIPGILAPIAQSRREANKIKREEPITVVIGNPPYREKAKGMGGWVEAGDQEAGGSKAPLADWMPPKAWKAGAHAKHLRNLYVYFWRWATWKVFDRHPEDSAGIVCFITVAGFLGGPGFQKMRDYLRRTCDDIWVVDCSPEGHQPAIATRIFQGVQQPVCIVLASRSPENQSDVPAKVRFRTLPEGDREAKFTALARMGLGESEWTECPEDWRAPFLPVSTGPWSTYPALTDFFVYNGAGVQPKRVWVIAPDAESLIRRWNRLIQAPQDEREHLFHATLRKGVPADRHVRSVVREGLPGFRASSVPLIDENGPCPAPVPYAFRSFNRQWIIPDARVITQPNAELWATSSPKQVYLTALSRTPPSNGPALTVTGLVPDLDHYKGSFGGRVFPLWRDAPATEPNVKPALLDLLSSKLATTVNAEDVLAYIAALAAHPAYTARFQEDLRTPGLRLPLTADGALFAEAVALGRTVTWLHTFGERMADKKAGRSAGPPRLPTARRPRIPAAGTIPPDADSIDYDEGEQRLLIGAGGYVERVPPAVWEYEVSGKQVLVQWFSYRRRDRSRPIIGTRRSPSPLGEIQPDRWLAEYTTELLNVLNVLGWLVDLEPQQAGLLDRVCAGPLLSEEALREAGALTPPTPRKRKRKQRGAEGPGLFPDQ